MQIDSFEQLESVLRDFSTWEQRGGYDYGAAVCLLAACLDNLRKYAVEEELAELRFRLDAEQAAFILRLAQLLQSSPAQ